ncbi:hypothetical protein GJ699_30030 [Duganella sp. FT80W]|uniref:Uncharacterized protein n=1 Tax=Duganella guangzhouensis TaxID=2666084 RepID=A0A6I2L7Q3_9BURK|nr:hypothetical protein [Duganella guangzhouensis]MRW94221.1 hypothetical protein [Duganella guangzhouensis]
MADPQSQAAIETLADHLSASANALHARLMRAIRNPGPDGALPGISQGVAQALFENEVALRQRANSLYLDAAVLAASGLGAQQQQLLDLTALAQQKIDHINRLKDLVDLAAELLTLGAAVATGKPERLLSPLEKLKQHIEAL